MHTTRRLIEPAFLAWVVWAIGCSPGGHDPVPAFTPRAGGPTRVSAGMQTARAGHSATRLDATQVLIVGGRTLEDSATHTAEVFDAATGFSTPLGSRMTQARTQHAAVPLPSGEILLAGGYGTLGESLDSMERFNPQTREFSRVPQRLRRPRAGSAATVHSDLLLLACGAEEDSLEAWDLSTLTLRYSIDGLPGGPRVGAQLVPYDERHVLLYGGEAGQPPVWIDVIEQAKVVRHEVFESGTVVRAPDLSPDLLVVGERTIQRLNPDLGEDDPPVFLEWGLLMPRNHPLVLVGSQGLYVFSGTRDGFPVSVAERVRPGSAEVWPPASGTRTEMTAVLLDGGVVVLAGGVEADGRPSALIDLFLPAGAPTPYGDRVFTDARRRKSEDEAVGEQLAQTRDERSQAEDRIRALEVELASIRRGLSDEGAAALGLSQRISQARDRLADEDARFNQVQQRVGERIQRVQQLRQDQAAAQADRQAAQNELEAAQSELENVRRDREAIEARVRELEDALAVRRERIQALRARRDAIAGHVRRRR